MAQMQDTHQLEARVAAKVTGQITQELAPVAGASPSDGLLEIGKRLLARAAPPPPPFSPRPAGTRRGWLLWELWAEARIIPRMYTDPRYRMSWVARIVPVVMLLVFIWPTVGLSLIPLLGPLLAQVPFVDKFVQLLAAFVMFKILGHEVRRYREVSPDLPRSLKG
jgi:hypothetical protein